MVTVAEVPKDTSYVATVDAAGNATVTVLPSWGYPWLISQVTVEMFTAPAGASCVLRKRGNLVSPLIAAGDAAAGDPPVTLYPGEPLTVEWTGCTPGDQGKVTVWYQQVGYG